MEKSDFILSCTEMKLNKLFFSFKQMLLNFFLIAVRREYKTFGD